MHTNRFSNQPPTDAQRLAVIEEIVKRLDLHLIGQDGNGGFIAKTNERLSEIDKERSWVKGAFATLSGVVSILGFSELIRLFRGH